jgi:prepilin-type N-terminal cleavage/methylation domain-containing protein
MNIKTKGFTLIELLVVIAIIGILSSVVLASLNSARTKGSDAAVKSNLSGVRANAELQYDNMNGCYSNTGTSCSATTPAVVTAAACPAAGATNIFGFTSIASQIAQAKSASNGLDACAATVGGGAWAAAVHLKTTGKSFCVDSTGKAVEQTVADQTQATLNAKVTGGACATS